MFDNPSAEQHKSRTKTIWQGTVYPWFICLLAAVFYLYDFVLRVTPSVMIHPLMKAYGVNAFQIGFLSAFYYYVYTPLQLPSGTIVDKYSRRWVLAASCLICALGGLIFAHTETLYLACLGRAMMGFGSAFAFVGALKLASLWLPPYRFALYSALTTALGTVGAVITDTMLSHGVERMGWRHTVEITSWFGVVLAIIIVLVVRDRPSWVPRVPSEYRRWSSILKRLFNLFRNPGIWLNGIVGAFMFLPISVFASLWGVAFLKTCFGLTNTEAAFTTSLIFIGCSLGLPIFGWLSDKIERRRVFLLLGSVAIFLLSSLIIYAPIHSKGLLYVLLFLVGFFVAPQALVFAIAKEISPPRSTGISSAATNFLVTLSAAIFQPLIGYFLDKSWHGKIGEGGIHIYSTQNYHHAFLVFVGGLLVAIILCLFVPETRCKMIHPLAKKFQKKIASHRTPRHACPH
jgi:MFS family permease